MAVDEAGKVTFTEAEQAKVDEIVKERLARAKAEIPPDYETYKEIAEALEEFDIKGTPTEKKEALKAASEAKKQAAAADTYKEATEAYKGVDELPSDAVINALAKKWGKDPKAVEKALLNQIDSSEAAERKAESSRDFARQVKEFEAKYKDIDVEKLGENKKFIKFIKGKKLPLIDLYEDFVEYEGENQTEIETLRKTIQTKEANEKNASASTGSVKGESPKAEFISREEVEKHRGDQQWFNKNYQTIIKSRAKW